MQLVTYAARHKALISDWSDTWSPAAFKRGWQCLAVFMKPDDCEPDMLLIKSPHHPNYQVRNVSSELASGTMLTELQVKNWIKAKADSKMLTAH